MAELGFLAQRVLRSFNAMLFSDIETLLAMVQHVNPYRDTFTHVVEAGTLFSRSDGPSTLSRLHRLAIVRRLGLPPRTDEPNYGL